MAEFNIDFDRLKSRARQMRPTEFAPLARTTPPPPSYDLARGAFFSRLDEDDPEWLANNDPEFKAAVDIAEAAFLGDDTPISGRGGQYTPSARERAMSGFEDAIGGSLSSVVRGWLGLQAEARGREGFDAWAAQMRERLAGNPLIPPQEKARLESEWARVNALPERERAAAARKAKYEQMAAIEEAASGWQGAGVGIEAFAYHPTHARERGLTVATLPIGLSAARGALGVGLSVLKMGALEGAIVTPDAVVRHNIRTRLAEAAGAEQEVFDRIDAERNAEIAIGAGAGAFLGALFKGGSNWWQWRKERKLAAAEAEVAEQKAYDDEWWSISMPGTPPQVAKKPAPAPSEMETIDILPQRNVVARNAAGDELPARQGQKVVGAKVKGAKEVAVRKGALEQIDDERFDEIIADESGELLGRYADDNKDGVIDGKGRVILFGADDVPPPKPKPEPEQIPQGEKPPEPVAPDDEAARDVRFTSHLFRKEQEGGAPLELKPTGDEVFEIGGRKFNNPLSEAGKRELPAAQDLYARIADSGDNPPPPDRVFDVEDGRVVLRADLPTEAVGFMKKAFVTGRTMKPLKDGRNTFAPLVDGKEVKRGEIADTSAAAVGNQSSLEFGRATQAVVAKTQREATPPPPPPKEAQREAKYGANLARQISAAYGARADDYFAMLDEIGAIPDDSAFTRSLLDFGFRAGESAGDRAAAFVALRETANHLPESAVTAERMGEIVAAARKGDSPEVIAKRIEGVIDKGAKLNAEGNPVGKDVDGKEITNPNRRVVETQGAVVRQQADGGVMPPPPPKPAPPPPEPPRPTEGGTRYSLVTALKTAGLAHEARVATDVPVNSIKVNTARFQQRKDIAPDSEGLKKEGGLEQQRYWDSGLAGVITVWVDRNGQRWLADGHQRLGLAKRSGQKNLRLVDELHEADGWSADMAFVYVAWKNLNVEKGGWYDAAHFARRVAESTDPNAQMAERALRGGLKLDALKKLSNALAIGESIAKLEDSAFKELESLKSAIGSRGAQIKMIADATAGRWDTATREASQRKLIEYTARTRRSDAEITQRIQTEIDNVNKRQTPQGEQENLLGQFDEVREDFIAETLAGVTGALMKQIRANAKLIGTAARRGIVEKIKETGGDVNVAALKAEKMTNDEIMDWLQVLINQQTASSQSALKRAIADEAAALIDEVGVDNWKKLKQKERAAKMSPIVDRLVARIDDFYKGIDDARFSTVEAAPASQKAAVIEKAAASRAVPQPEQATAASQYTPAQKAKIMDARARYEKARRDAGYEVEDSGVTPEPSLVESEAVGAMTRLLSVLDDWKSKAKAEGGDTKTIDAIAQSANDYLARIKGAGDGEAERVLSEGLGVFDFAARSSAAFDDITTKVANLESSFWDTLGKLREEAKADTPEARQKTAAAVLGKPGQPVEIDDTIPVDADGNVIPPAERTGEIAKTQGGLGAIAPPKLAVEQHGNFTLRETGSGKWNLWDGDTLVKGNMNYRDAVTTIARKQNPAESDKLTATRLAGQCAGAKGN